MAQIESIYSPEVEGQLKRIYTEIEKHQKKIVEVSKLSVDFYGGKTANKPMDFDKIVQGQKKLEIQNERLRQSEERLIISANKLNQAKEREIQKLQASQNLYNKTQQQLNKVQSAYNELAVKKERYNNLTTFEENRLKTLQAVTEKYNTTLKAVDGTVGKHTRNVGNYSSAFNPLSNSINQLTREMPAFTYSVQTGFMALSNNIPIFTDAIGQAVNKNKELRAEGQPTKSVLSQLAGAFLSWGTALSVGITLLTVYGKEIGNFIAGLSESSAGVKSLKEQQTQLNDALEKGNENASKEISELDILYRKSTDVTLSIEQRKKAVNDLQELYPSYFENIKDETILNGKAEKSYFALRDAILAKYMADAIGQQLQVNAQKRIKDEFQLIKDIAYLKEKIEKDYTKTYINEAGERVKVIDSYYGELSSAEMKLQNIKNATKKDDALLLKMQGEYLSKAVVEKKKETEETEKNTKAKTKNNIVAKDSVKSIKDSIDLIVNNPSNEFLQEEIRLLQERLALLKDEEEARKELKKWLDEYKEGFKDDFIANSGFSKIFDLIDNFDKLKTDGVATALAISDAFQQAFNTIASNSQANFDAERDLNERRYNIAMQFTNGSAEAEEYLALEKERRNKEIATREAQSRKRLAKFNIAINTAQAMVAQLAATPFPIGTGFLLTIAALGAAQMAMVSSQQIPEFYKGTENAPEGWAKTDERGAEIHTDSKGNIKDFGSGKGTRLKYLQKGDKILNAKKTSELLFKNQSLPIENSNFVNIDLSSVESKLDKLVNKSEFTLVKDANGERIFEKHNGMVKELKNNRIKLKPRNVRA